MTNLRIEATDGMQNQYKRLKPGTTIEEANEIMQQLFDDDYLGLDYYLLDDNDNELYSLEQ